MRNFFKKIFDVCKAVVGAVWDETKISLAGGGVMVVGSIIVGLGGFIAIASFPAMIVLAIYGQWGWVVAGFAARVLVHLGLKVFEKFGERMAQKGAQANA